MMKYFKKWSMPSLFLIFLALSIIALLPQLAKQVLWINSWDVPFHLSRMYEIEKGFELGKWFPDISAYTFGQNGYGVNLFYGYSFTYFVSLIYFVTQHAVTSVLIGYIVILTTAMLLNYHAGKLFFTGSQANLKSFAFSTIYVLAPAVFGQMQVRGLPGELVGILLFPAVLAGFYSILFTERKSWIFAGVTSALTVTNHVLSTFLLLIVLIVMFVVFLYQKRATVEVFLQLFKAGILALLLSAFYVLPFLQQLLTTRIAGANQSWLSVKTLDSVQAAINNSAILNWSTVPVGVFVFVMVIAIACGMFSLKITSAHLKNIAGWLAVVGVAVFYLPTDILSKTPLHVFQVMARFYPIVMVLAVLFVIEGLDLFREKGFIQLKTFKWLCLLGIVLGLSSAWVLQSKVYYQTSKNSGNYKTGKVLNPQVVSNGDFIYQLVHFYQLPLGSQDYLGKDHVNFVNGYQVPFLQKKSDTTNIAVDGKYKGLKLTHQGYTFEVKNIPATTKQLILPMTNYKGWKVVGGNGKSLNISTVNGRLAVNPTGNNIIKLSYHKTLLHKFAIVISVITVISLVGWYGIVYVIRKTNGKNIGFE